MTLKNAREQAPFTTVEANELKLVEGGVCNGLPGYGLPLPVSVPHPKAPGGNPFPKLG